MDSRCAEGATVVRARPRAVDAPLVSEVRDLQAAGLFGENKIKTVMDSIADGMVSYTGAGRVSFPPPHNALHNHIQRKLGGKSRSRLLYAALPIAILLAETELDKDSQSLTTLFLAAPLREAGAPTRTYPQILKEMESDLQQTNARHARVVASIAGRQRVEVARAVESATTILRAELEQRELVEAQNLEESKALTDRIADLENTIETVEETTLAVEERAAHLVELANMRARHAHARSLKDREHRARVTEEVRRKIALKGENSVLELTADNEDNLRTARQKMREAESEARRNTTAAEM